MTEPYRGAHKFPLVSFGGLRPPNPLTRSLAGTPTPRSARVAHSLPLVRAVYEIASRMKPSHKPPFRGVRVIRGTRNHVTNARKSVASEPRDRRLRQGFGGSAVASAKAEAQSPAAHESTCLGVRGRSHSGKTGKDLPR